MELKVLTKTIVTAIRENYDEEQRRILFHDAVANLIKDKFEGKKLTKRLQTEMEKKFPEHTIYFSNEKGIGQAYLMIWGSGIDYNKRCQLFLGYSKDLETYSLETFEKHDIANGSAAKARNQARIEEMNNVTKLADLALTMLELERLKGEFKERIEGMTDIYDIEKIDLTTEERN